MTTWRSAHVAGDQRAGGHERLLAHDDARDEHHATPDATRATEDGSEQRLAAPTATHRVVIGRQHAGTEEHLVLDDRLTGHVDTGLDQDAGADGGAEVDRRAPTHDGLLSDRDSFPDLRLIADDGSVGDIGARVDDGTTAHADTSSEYERGQYRAGGA